MRVRATHHDLSSAMPDKKRKIEKKIKREN